MIVARCGVRLMCLYNGLLTIVLSACNIICFNSNQLVGNGFLLPAGPLREKFDSIKRAKIIVINGFKNICRDIGYKDGTEKMADCVKDLYLKQVNSQSSTTTTKRKIDPSFWDDIIGLSSGVMNGSSKTSKSGTVCFKTGEETGGHNKVCKYSCTGSITTINIGAAQICPMKINK